MPVLDVSNPKVINFLLESYEKESIIRMRWVNKHASNFKKASVLTRNATNYNQEDITKATIEAGMAATTRDHITAARAKHTAPIPDYLSVKINKTQEINIESMKPIKSDLKYILLESSTVYLKKRSLLKPEEKYNFVECSSWRYGWQLNDSLLKMRGPEHGKVNQVINDSRSRVGPQPDPDHYQPTADGQKVFSSL